jgi:hypothetical protein
MNQSEPTCLELHRGDCEGKVEYHHNPDRDDFKTFPRCEKHQARRLEQAQGNMVYRSPAPPPWFDEGYAGERWEEDY